jgi:magnesium-transporting ATPase (P-type)
VDKAMQHEHNLDWHNLSIEKVLSSLTRKSIQGTPMVWFTVIAVTLGQFLMTYAPFMQAIFGTENVPLQDGLLIVAIGVVLFAILEIEKQIRLALRPAIRHQYAVST